MGDMRAVKFVSGEYYHIFNRGVEKRVLFNSVSDFQRFYNSMYLFNNTHYANPGNFSPPSTLNHNDIEFLRSWDKGRDPFVRIVSFCLLSNHFHLLVRQLRDDGIVMFMHRLGMGYARYFNKRYRRIGRLYEGTFKAIHVQRDAQLEHLPRYIHLNALDRTDLQWREGKIKQWVTARESLDSYPWSSHHVYAGKLQPLPLVDEASVRRLFPIPAEYIAFLKRWSNRFYDFQRFQDL